MRGGWARDRLGSIVLMIADRVPRVILGQGKLIAPFGYEFYEPTSSQNMAVKLIPGRSYVCNVAVSMSNVSMFSSRRSILFQHRKLIALIAPLGYELYEPISFQNMAVKLITELSYVLRWNIAPFGYEFYGPHFPLVI